MQNRLFTLPKDVFEEVVLSRLSSLRDRKAAIVTVSRDLDQAKVRYANYLTRAMSSNQLALLFISSLERKDIAWFLQTHYASGSQRAEKLFVKAHAEDATAADYAVYALTANVKTLHAELLMEAIQQLTSVGCADHIIRSLNIIHHYLTNSDTNYDKELKALIVDANGAYINLSGATIINNFYQCDLSYANFSGCEFYSLVSSANLECANFQNARFDARTIFNNTKTDNMHVTGLTWGNGFIIESEIDPETNEERLEVPALAPLLAARNEERKPASKGCSLM